MGIRTALIALATLAAGWEPASAQQSRCAVGDNCHGLGAMAMSPDGALIAAVVSGQPATELFLIDVTAQRATIIQAPVSHRHIFDMAWSPDGDELTFVTSETTVLSGEARHVWRLRPGAPAPTIDLLADIACVRRPVLSADGARLVMYEAIVIEHDRCQSLSMYAAYAIFEHTLADGAVTRRTAGHTAFAGEMFYDRSGGLLVTRYEPVFRTLVNRDGSVLWFSRDDAGRTAQQWAQEQGKLPAFRIGPGETLPEWPTAVPARDAPSGAVAIRALDDGRIAVFGATTPPQPLDWYDENGRPRTPSRTLDYRYFALAPDGSSALLSAPGLTANAGRTGGGDLSTDARFFAEIVSEDLPRGIRQRGEPQDFRDQLWFYVNGERTLSIPIATLIQGAQTITLSLDVPPILPVVSTPRSAR